MKTLEQLDAAVKAVAPIHGVAILRPEREAEPGWDVFEGPVGKVRIDFADWVTPEQREAAAAVAMAFVPKPEKTKAEKLADLKRLKPEEREALLLELLADRME